MKAVTIERFPGLNLWADPGDAPGAIDALNVTIEPGRVRTRDGSVNFSTEADLVVFLARSPAHMIVGTGALLRALTAAGALVASTAITLGDNGGCGVSLGTASASYFYFVGAGGAGVRRWDGAAWTTPATAFGVPLIVTMSPTDNRLVYGDTTNTLWFSDAGDPTTFTLTNSLRLHPGDGELFRGAAVYANQMFIFKQTKFFVFYGTNKDPFGAPLFNYRVVDSGVGLHPNSPQAVCVGADGVYFIGNDGIYRTTGGTPVKISQAIEPFFLRTVGSLVSPFWQGSVWDATNTLQRLAWHDGRLYCSLSTAGSTSTVFVYHTALDAWTAWQFPSAGAVGGMASYLRSTTAADVRALYVGLRAAQVVNRITPNVATDPTSQAIVSRYRLPFEAYGSPGQKRIRETIVEGIGSPTIQWSRDWGSLATGSAVTLGTSPAIAVARQRLAIRGRAFSLQAGAASGAWSINRVQANVDDAIRPAGVTVT